MRWFYPTLAKVIGHSLREGASFYDAGGRKLGESLAFALRDGATYYDASGTKLGESRANAAGTGDVFLDASGRRLGTSTDHVLGSGITFADDRGEVGKLFAGIGQEASYHPYDRQVTQRANKAGFRFVMVALAAAVVFFVVANPVYEALTGSIGPLGAAIPLTLIVFGGVYAFETLFVERVLRWRASRYDYVTWAVLGLICGAATTLPPLAIAGAVIAMASRWLVWRRR